MFKLAQYLKPYALGIIITLALLLVQALSDLNLPNLMSDIVNVGLQQGGIEHAAPDAVSPKGYALMTIYMTGGEQDLVESHYAQGAAESAHSYYPELGGSVYRKTPRLDSGTLAALDQAFGRAADRIVDVLSRWAETDGQSLDISEGLNENFDITVLYELLNASAIPHYEEEEPAAEGDLQAGQTGVYFARAFYNELGLDTQAMQTRYILKVGLYMLLIALLGGAAAVFIGLMAPRVAAGAARDLRRDLFNKVESFSQHEFDQFSSASLITRCTNDVTQVQMLVGMGLRMMCYAPMMGIGGVVMALGQSVAMSWIIALAVAVLLGVIIIVMIVALPRFKAIQKLIDRLNRVSREALSGLMVIRAFGAQQHERARFDAANRDLTQTNLFVQRVMATVMPAITLIMNGVTLLIIWVGANRISESAMQVGDMMAFMQYAMQIIFSFMMIAMMFVYVPRAAVSGDRIAEVLATELRVRDADNPQTLQNVKGLVEFKDVHFRYHNAEADALSGITFTARPGETTAIIGATGSGKTTLVNLLVRFYDVTGGCISLDHTDIRQVTQEDLRARIGYVPQKASLLTGTIASNIRYGWKDAPDEAVKEAAEIAQAIDFIQESPDGFETDISQGGANVSGGQKQRLSIARALVKKPEVLIFDDSFSALDFKTDAKLRKALKEKTGHAAVIVVAQRVGTIMHADQIIVLDHGTIEGLGTHEELLASCPAYYEIASSQLSEENLKGYKKDGKAMA